MTNPKITNCQHTNRKHKGHGMCASCCRANRLKITDEKASKCEHTDQPVKASGLCKSFKDDPMNLARAIRYLNSPPANDFFKKEESA